MNKKPEKNNKLRRLIKNYKKLRENKIKNLKMEENPAKNKVRCFIAVKFPEKIVKEIEKLQKELGEKNFFIGKFTKPENLHLTLKFLGEINEKIVEDVRQKLKNVKALKFGAGLGGVGVFSPKFIRIIWVKITGKEICELQKQIDGVLGELFESENRFMSHLTIARVKKVRNKERFLDDVGKINFNKEEFDVNKFYLMKSELKPDGPVYSVIEEYVLG